MFLLELSQSMYSPKSAFMDESQRYRWSSIQLLRGGLIILCLGIGIVVSMAVATTPPVDIAGSSFLGIPFAAYLMVGGFSVILSAVVILYSLDALRCPQCHRLVLSLSSTSSCRKCVHLDEGIDLLPRTVLKSWIFSQPQPYYFSK